MNPIVIAALVDDRRRTLQAEATHARTVRVARPARAGGRPGLAALTGRVLLRHRAAVGHRGCELPAC